MRKNGRLLIVLGVGLACLAVALAFLMFTNANKSQAVEKAAPPVRVVVAAKDVPAHQILRAEDLVDEQVDKDLLKGGEVLVKSEVIGKASKTGLVKGQRLMTADLEVSGLTNDIEKGKRALAIPVDRLNTLGGLVREGDYIDVIFSVKVNLLYVLPSLPLEMDTATAGEREFKNVLPNTPPSEAAPYPYPGDPGSRFKMRGADGKTDPLAKVIVQDVKVLRVSTAPPPPAQGQQQQQQQQPATTAPTAGDLMILELTNEQAELVKFIMDNGGAAGANGAPASVAYTFIVRAKDDHEKVTSSGITFDLLVEKHELPAPGSVTLPTEQKRP